MLPRTLSLLFLIAMLVSLLTACSRQSNQDQSNNTVEESAILLAYLEENGNLINSDLLPSLVDPELVYENIDNPFYLIIDVRPEEAYREGHIKQAVNVRPDHMLDYFENHIDPNSFQAIILYCNNAYLSAHVNTILVMLGYQNVFTLRYGLSSWNQEIAEAFWLQALSSHLDGLLEHTANPKHPKGKLPALNTGETEPYRILHTRAKELLNLRPEAFLWPLEKLEESNKDVYLVAYWPESRHEKGHLPGSVQYAPKKSLHSSTELFTLPPDKPIVTYCYTHNSAFVTTFLRLLGYEAYNMPYGSNAFIHDEITRTEVSTRSFTEDHIRHFPLEGVKNNGMELRQNLDIEQDKTPVPVAGGC